MRFSLRRWRPRHLFLAWVVYWIGLAVVGLWPALAAGWRLSQNSSHGSVNAGVTDGVFNANIIQSGQTLWAGSVALSTIGLLIAVPPLALWVVWLLTSSRTNNAGEIRPTQTRQRELKEADRTPGMTESFSQTSIRQRREES